ncbi:putative NADH dehydrogenase [ubiquinone] 1 alpha subcomplex subunit 12 [Hypsibius exemplaris]|uniref:NADH dehydrogenase [ubiquinone] 1 alpha subcomplex subunit 12 n=1 Tax=Hypsibius exemplaris TaxID=2072580 RepID=A0A1W0W8Y6_HYPEX|nr:putative NADH dehydrogenase [ubiquinone] 1 alpha subcomplex subunit 12 [Hypsibius exemplaris]
MSLVDKLGNLIRAVKQNGGLFKSIRTFYFTDDLKWGTHVGTDKYGNRYFENNYYFMGRNRWVLFNDAFRLEYDGSQIPPEWHQWMHYTTDKTPIERPPVQHRWMVQHEENKTGSSKDTYYPYSTTRTKIESWMPKNLR